MKYEIELTDFFNADEWELVDNIPQDLVDFQKELEKMAEIIYPFAKLSPNIKPVDYDKKCRDILFKRAEFVRERITPFYARLATTTKVLRRKETA